MFIGSTIHHRNQPKCPKKDEWIKNKTENTPFPENPWHIYMIKYYSAIRKDDEIMHFAAYVEGIPAEWQESGGKDSIQNDLSQVWIINKLT